MHTRIKIKVVTAQFTITPIPSVFCYGAAGVPVRTAVAAAMRKGIRLSRSRSKATPCRWQASAQDSQGSGLPAMMRAEGMHLAGIKRQRRAVFVGSGSLSYLPYVEDGHGSGVAEGATPTHMEQHGANICLARINGPSAPMNACFHACTGRRGFVLQHRAAYLGCH